MSRTDHYVGLNRWAKKFVRQTQTICEKGVRTYPDGRQEPFEREVVELVKVERLRDITVLHCRWFPRYRYTLPDGRVFEEYLQEHVWAGGPHLYMALKRVTQGKRKYRRVVKESLWKNAQMGF